MIHGFHINLNVHLYLQKRKNKFSQWKNKNKERKIVADRIDFNETRNKQMHLTASGGNILNLYSMFWDIILCSTISFADLTALMVLSGFVSEKYGISARSNAKKLSLSKETRASLPTIGILWFDASQVYIIPSRSIMSGVC